MVECFENGEFLLTKPPKTGGLVSVATASEQLVYEIGDPRRYLLPDVIADFSQVAFTQVGGVSALSFPVLSTSSLLRR